MLCVLFPEDRDRKPDRGGRKQGEQKDESPFCVCMKNQPQGLVMDILAEQWVDRKGGEVVAAVA